MKDFITTFKTIGEYNTWKSSIRFVKPNATYISGDKSIITIKAPSPYNKDYLTFTALDSGTFKFSQNALQYSLNNGATWTTLAANTTSPTVIAGNKILWKATLTPSDGCGTFSATGNFEVSGNIMSLLFGDNFIGQISLSGTYVTFGGLFASNTKLVNAKNLILPATTLAQYCYQSMFQCCTALTTAPELPATTLAQYCYISMFYGCTSLTTAPELHATTLTSNCYNNMFKNCTNLNYIKCLATDISASGCTNSWVNGVAATGTFIKADSMSFWTTGTSGIPSGWTEQNAA